MRVNMYKNGVPTPTGQVDDSLDMSLRDYFAAFAIGGSANRVGDHYDNMQLAKHAYEIADAMMKARDA